MPVIPNGYAEVNWVMVCSGDPQPMEVTIGVEVTGNVLPADIFNLYTNGGWQDLFHDLATFEYQMVKGVALIGQASGPPVIVETAFADNGAASGTAVPQNTSVLVRKATGFGGRKNRGRFYWPGAPEDKVSHTGTLDDTYRAALQADLDNILGLAGDSPWGLYQVLHTDNSTPTEINAFLVESTVATQRRRLRR